MDFWQLAESWSPVWEFESRELPRALVERCLGAAHAAPAPPGIPPWRFTVLMAAESRAHLATAVAAAVGGDAAAVAACRQAPVLVVLSTPARHGDPPGPGRGGGGVGACLQNLVLCAWDAGLGALTLEGARWGETAAVRAACALEADEAPCALVALGFPAAVPPRRPRPPLAQVTRWMV